ncbi:MAG: hypothetical protein M1834_003198 [Cirrosporium novae-zelandiae]|nr:MAG: hypothetical protein M1834_003198 [Cirrosporium novae-zelandiae]
MVGKLIFFSGAPETSSLNWEDKCLSNELLPCFKTEGFSLYRLEKGQFDVESSRIAAWRSLPYKPQHLPTGISQNADIRRAGQTLKSKSGIYKDAEAPSFAFVGLSFVSPTDEDGAHEDSFSSTESDILSQFYEHSIAIHEEIPSSQLPSQASSLENTSFYDTTDISFLTNTTTSSYVTLQLPSGIPLTSLACVPTVKELMHLQPQTITINIVCAVISSPSVRTIETHRNTRHPNRMDLYELLVADETRSGFGVNFWVENLQQHISGDALKSPRNKKNTEGGTLKETLDSLRPRDIILIRTIALSSFRGKVYGQSLRKETTKLDLLYCQHVDGMKRRGLFKARDLDSRKVIDSGVDAILLRKAQKVREWVVQFVGPEAVTTNNFRGDTIGDTMPMTDLPPDTQVM